jgi:DNA-binding transcriptional MocR family regulator
MALYKAAKQRNVLLSPGWFFRSESDDGRADDRWMRVNVSRCETTVLTRVLTLLRELTAA